MPTTSDYLTQLISDKADLAANLIIKGVAASSSETFTELVPKVLQIPSGGGMSWGDTIADDWDTIIANAAAGTVSNYSIGDTKTIEFIYDNTPIVWQFMLVAKSHEIISGTQNNAALTFQIKNKSLIYSFNNTNTNVGGWMGEAGDIYSTSLDEDADGELVHGCGIRKMLYGLYKAFPLNLQTAIRTVDKIYDDANASLQTSKEKIFLPCFEELGGTFTAGVSGQGTAYDYYNATAKRKKDGIPVTYYGTRSRRTTNNSTIVIINSNTGAVTYGNGNTFTAMCPCICL